MIDDPATPTAFDRFKSIFESSPRIIGIRNLPKIQSAINVKGGNYLRIAPYLNI